MHNQPYSDAPAHLPLSLTQSSSLHTHTQVRLVRVVQEDAVPGAQILPFLEAIALFFACAIVLRRRIISW